MATTLIRLAAYCWNELEHYRGELDDSGGDDALKEYRAFCSGCIKAYERVLKEMEMLEEVER